MLTDPFTIVLIAAAVVVFWKLKSVLGQRTGLERPPVDVSDQNVKSPPNLRVIENPEVLPQVPLWEGVAEPGSDVAKGLEKIGEQQRDFDAAGFIVGAEAAHEMILEAFSKGDKVRLKPLLAKPVYDDFVTVIDQNQKQGLSKVFQFVGAKSTTLKAADLEASRASLTVEFVSELISATLDKSGATVEGDSKAVVEVTDLWTFDRDITSRDPNWKLTVIADPSA